MTAEKVIRMVVKCDRCGADTADMGKARAKPLKDWGELKARGDKDDTFKVGIIAAGPSTASPYGDLCPDCWVAFKEWWSKGVDHGASEAA